MDKCITQLNVFSIQMGTDKNIFIRRYCFEYYLEDIGIVLNVYVKR